MKTLSAAMAALAFLAATAGAAVVAEMVEYMEGDTVLEGYLAYDDSVKGKRPGVLVVHEWMGITGYEKKRAGMLAELGYIAFVADIYGKGIRAKDKKEAAALSGRLLKDRTILRKRVKAGLEKLKGHALADASRMAAIGYCFGGSTVLELARSGAEVNGVVSFHGGLAATVPAKAKGIKARVLILHGANDPYVDEAEAAAFREEMRGASADWQMIYLGGAVHSFTNPGSGEDPSKGVAYDEKADRRSWEAMKLFFREIF